jgi:hypothetical protein
MIPITSIAAEAEDESHQGEEPQNDQCATSEARVNVQAGSTSRGWSGAASEWDAGVEVGVGEAATRKGVGSPASSLSRCGGGAQASVWVWVCRSVSSREA